MRLASHRYNKYIRGKMRLFCFINCIYYITNYIAKISFQRDSRNASLRQRREQATAPYIIVASVYYITKLSFQRDSRNASLRQRREQATAPHRIVASVYYNFFCMQSKGVHAVFEFKDTNINLLLYCFACRKLRPFPPAKNAVAMYALFILHIACTSII